MGWRSWSWSSVASRALRLRHDSILYMYCMRVAISAACFANSLWKFRITSYINVVIDAWIATRPITLMDNADCFFFFFNFWIVELVCNYFGDVMPFSDAVLPRRRSPFEWPLVCVLFTFFIEKFSSTNHLSVVSGFRARTLPQVYCRYMDRYYLLSLIWFAASGTRQMLRPLILLVEFFSWKEMDARISRLHRNEFKRNIHILSHPCRTRRQAHIFKSKPIMRPPPKVKSSSFYFFSPVSIPTHIYIYVQCSSRVTNVPSFSANTVLWAYILF